MAMQNTPEHVVEWLDNSRQSLSVLRTTLSTADKPVRLKAIREHYVILASLRSMFNRDAYFVGVPGRNRSRLT